MNITNFENMKSNDLIDYILDTHHIYTKKALPVIFSYLVKITRVHGSKRPELNSLLGIFTKLKDELEQHLLKEERILFPYIKQLVMANENGSEKPDSCFGNVRNPIRMMEIEHDSAGGLIDKMKKITNNLTVPDNACASYRICFQELRNLESDLYKHINLENNLLHPRAIEIESKFI